jgi:hypothetical protein
MMLFHTARLLKDLKRLEAKGDTNKNNNNNIKNNINSNNNNNNIIINNNNNNNNNNIIINNNNNNNNNSKGIITPLILWARINPEHFENEIPSWIMFTQCQYTYNIGEN